jgi:putative flippase GtrA
MQIMKPPPPRGSGNFSLRSLFTFLFVGGLATALQYAIILVAVYAGGWPLVWGSTLGFIVSAIANYLLNARLTFRSTQAHANMAPRFVLVAGTGLLLNYCLLSLLLSFSVQAAVAQILTTIGVLIWNYVISGIWTFKQKTA